MGSALASASLSCCSRGGLRGGAEQQCDLGGAAQEAPSGAPWRPTHLHGGPIAQHRAQPPSVVQRDAAQEHLAHAQRHAEHLGRGGSVRCTWGAGAAGCGRGVRLGARGASACAECGRVQPRVGGSGRTLASLRPASALSSATVVTPAGAQGQSRSPSGMDSWRTKTRLTSDLEPGGCGVLLGDVSPPDPRRGGESERSAHIAAPSETALGRPPPCTGAAPWRPPPAARAPRAAEGHRRGTRLPITPETACGQLPRPRHTGLLEVDRKQIKHPNFRPARPRARPKPELDLDP